MASPRGSRLACTGGTDAGLVAGERRDSTRRKDVAMMYGRLTVNPIHAAWNTVARFDDYGSAQRAVDRLSDDGFPVEKLDIVGSDLQLVERVTGRLTKWRAAGAGAPSGMWAGLLVGILFGLFTPRDARLGIVAAGVRPRGGWGGGFGVLGAPGPPRGRGLRSRARG